MKEILETVNSGDIFFSGDNRFRSLAIQNTTSTNYPHCGIFFWVKDGVKDFVIERTNESGKCKLMIFDVFLEGDPAFYTLFDSKCMWENSGVGFRYINLFRLRNDVRDNPEFIGLCKDYILSMTGTTFAKASGYFKTETSVKNYDRKLLNKDKIDRKGHHCTWFVSSYINFLSANMFPEKPLPIRNPLFCLPITLRTKLLKQGIDHMFEKDNIKYVLEGGYNHRNTYLNKSLYVCYNIYVILSLIIIVAFYWIILFFVK